MLGRASANVVRKKGLDEVTGDQPDHDQENVIDVDELLVEEVSIDGMCGVY
jgi:mycofactocin precursor